MDEIGNESKLSQVFGLVGNRLGSLYSGNGFGVRELRELAIDVINEFFGSVCAAVASILLRYSGWKGIEAQRVVFFANKFEYSTSIPFDQEIFRKLSIDLVKDALIILLRHNVVVMETQASVTD